MLFNLLSFTKRNTFLIALLLLVSPFMQADWFALNMTRGSTDISNEVFELHMLIFLDMCCNWSHSFQRYVLLDVGSYKEKESNTC